MSVKRPTTAKLKAHLAMVAFVTVATMMLVLTTVGGLSHISRASNIELASQQATIVQALAGTSPNAASLPGE